MTETPDYKEISTKLGINATNIGYATAKLQRFRGERVALLSPVASDVIQKLKKISGLDFVLDQETGNFVAEKTHPFELEGTGIKVDYIGNTLSIDAGQQGFFTNLAIAESPGEKWQKQAETRQGLSWKGF